jgi:predicted RND superfamily exporter protein
LKEKTKIFCFVFLEISTYHLLYKEHQIERETRVTESISRVGSAVFMAAFTTFAAGFSMTLSSLSSFRQMGQFLMTISMFHKERNVYLH